MKTKKDFRKKLNKFSNQLSKLTHWKNIRIGRKYLLSFSVAAVLFIISVIIVYFQLSVAENDIEKFEEDSIRTNQLSQMASLIQLKDVQIADYMITQRTSYLDEYEETLKEFDELKSILEPIMVTEKQQNLFELIIEYDDRMNDMFATIAEDPDSSENLAMARREQSNSLRISIQGAIDILIENTFEEQADSIENVNQSIKNSVLVLVIASGLAIIIGTSIVLAISHNITANLNSVVGITSEIAKGNLAVKDMDYEGKDEVGQLAQAINQMKGSIQSIILKVADASQLVTSRSEELTQSANEVNEGGDQIASTMQELSSGAETQANGAANLSEGMIDFIEIVNASEEEGQEITDSSSNVLDLTAEGTTLMNESVDQMKRIDAIISEAVGQVQGLDQQSSEISHLILVIKDIADQTNLLSLNAAIEAARAGEHGRGFAVVADEVRKLAEQVGESVSEITDIVESIQGETGQVVQSLNKGYEEVQEGTEQIEKTGQSFSTIDSSVSDMIERIVSISNNLKDIANNSNQMNDLIQDIASVSEESAAGVEQAAATVQETSSAMDEISYSAEELAKLAEQLNDEIQIFTLE